MFDYQKIFALKNLKMLHHDFINAQRISLKISHGSGCRAVVKYFDVYVKENFMQKVFYEF